MKKIIITIMLVFLMFSLGSCTNISGSKIIIENRELRTSELTEMKLFLNYNNPIKKLEIQNFHIQFITGKNLNVRKNNVDIDEDVAYDVKGPVTLNYTIYASGVYSSQKIETIEVVISSNDKRISQKITSDFILIRR